MESIKTVSDLGCNKFEFGRCVSCSNGYFFNSLGVCQQIPASCSKFDNVRAICRACYSGYELNSKTSALLLNKKFLIPIVGNLKMANAHSARSEPSLIFKVFV